MTGAFTPTRLRCEYLTNPSALEIAHPRLSWILQSEQPAKRAQYQTAYEILVASDKVLLDADQGDLWDSGRVFSSTSIHLPYEGKELVSGQRCWWKVRSWDQDEQPSVYSEPASWTMGLLTVDDWQAEWIGLERAVLKLAEIDPELEGLVASPYLRKAFEVPKTVTDARLYVTARGVYEVYLNGQRVSESVFAPGWTDYHRRIQYQAYDVQPLLASGENVLGAILGSGWYSGYIGFAGQHSIYGTAMQLLLQLHISYSDGTSQTIVSDKSWQGSTGAIVFSDMLMGETYDARRALTGWFEAGFDASGWQGVNVVGRDQTLLVCDRAEPVQITQEVVTRSITALTPDVTVFDLGQNMLGRVRLRVQGEAGTKVKLRFAEILNPDGTIYTENLRTARATDTYILRGEGVEIFAPHFTFHGFRYVEVSGYPGVLDKDAITGQVIHSATPTTGSFTCSDPMVNQLQQNIVWGQRSNFLSVPTDCPQRDERLGWMGDAQIFVRTAGYNMDVAGFFTKWMFDVADAQSPAGAFSDVAPRVVDVADGAPAWGDAGIIVPWTIYQTYGDVHILTQHYAAMVHWIEYIRQANPDLLWTQQLNNNFGDWLSIEAETSHEVLASAYFAYDVQLMSKIASVLDRQDDAQKYRELWHAMKRAFNKAYVAVDGRIESDTQTVYVLALMMDLLPAELRPLAAQHLVDDIEKRGWHLSTGFVGVGYLCPVLSETDHNDVAYRLLLNDTFPSWGYSIKHGATTIWERWDGWTSEHGFQTPEMNSFNHYSLGSVGQWLYQYVAGIDVDPEQPGYQHIIIRPHPDNQLTYAHATYESLYGLISSRWSLDNGELTLSISIPANTTATVCIPVAAETCVCEGSVPADQSEGVTYAGADANRRMYKLQSGQYKFMLHYS